MNIAENPWPMFVVLSTLAALLILSWMNRRKRWQIGLAAGLLMLAGGTFVVDHYVETDREKVSRYVVEMVNSFQQKKLEPTLSYFSADNFKDRLTVGMAMKMVSVQDDLRISDVSVRLMEKDNTAVSRFRVNATLSAEGYGNVGWQASRWELTWARREGDWKVIKVERLHPLEEKKIGLMGGDE